jgi:hypothetical protein
MLQEITGVLDGFTSAKGSGVKQDNGLSIIGKFHLTCHDADGNLKWEEEFENAVVDTGKKYLLDTLNTSTTAVGPYLGLMQTWSATAAADNMTTHAGWTEAAAGSIAARGTPTWTAASGTGTVQKTHSGTVSFTCGATGFTCVGCFIVCGTGAVTTPASTAGILYSAGNFTGKTLIQNDILQVTYTTTLA